MGRDRVRSVVGGGSVGFGFVPRIGIDHGTGFVFGFRIVVGIGIVVGIVVGTGSARGIEIVVGTGIVVGRAGRRRSVAGWRGGRIGGRALRRCTSICFHIGI